MKRILGLLACILILVSGIQPAAGADGTASTALSPSWTIMPVDATADVGQYSSLALFNNQVHIAYQDSTNNTVKYAVLNGATWSKETIDSAPGFGPSLAVDSSGIPHISYNTLGPKARYAVKNGASWNKETVDDQHMAMAALALKADLPRLAYYDVRPTPPSGPGTGLWFTAWTGAAWAKHQFGGVEIESGAPGSAPALQVDPDSGLTGLVYRNSKDDSLVYASLPDGGGWTSEVIVQGGTPHNPQLALWNDQPVVVFVDASGWITLAKKDGAAWKFSRIARGSSPTLSLAFDRYGKPNIAWCSQVPVAPDDLINVLNYNYWTGASWAGGPVFSFPCSTPSLKLDRYGYPHISYYDTDSHMLRYSRSLEYSSSGNIPTTGGSLNAPTDQTKYTFGAGVFDAAVTVKHVILYDGGVPPTSILAPVGHPFETVATYTTGGAKASLLPGQTYTLEVKYSYQSLWSLREDSLVLYYWDDALQQWQIEPTAVLDMNTNTITAHPDHLSVWGILGETILSYLPLAYKP